MGKTPNLIGGKLLITSIQFLIEFQEQKNEKDSEAMEVYLTFEIRYLDFYLKLEIRI